MPRKAAVQRQSIPTEEQDQIALVTWMTKNNIIHYAIPNGGKRSLTEGIRLKRCGVKSGVPDLCIPIPISSHHGLYIELKRVSGGVVSDNQKSWINWLRKHGYRAEVAHGFDEAKRIVCEYLGR